MRTRTLYPWVALATLPFETIYDNRGSHDFQVSQDDGDSGVGICRFEVWLENNSILSFSLIVLRCLRGLQECLGCGRPAKARGQQSFHHIMHEWCSCTRAGFVILLMSTAPSSLLQVRGGRVWHSTDQIVRHSKCVLSSDSFTVEATGVMR